MKKKKKRVYDLSVRQRLERKVLDIDLSDFLDPVDDAPELLKNTLLPEIVLPENSTNVLQQLEKAGFSHVVQKVRELQLSKGPQAVTDALSRIEKLEKIIDDTLDSEELILDDKMLKALVSTIETLYMLRAKVLMIPMGAIHPRNLIPKSVTVNNSQTNISVPGTKAVGRRVK